MPMLRVKTKIASLATQKARSNLMMLLLLLLIGEWIEPHAIKQRAESPLHLLATDELLVVKGGIRSGEFETLM